MVDIVTVGYELSRIFPDGTELNSGTGSIEAAPLFPTDLFAAAAHLLQSSGAYQYLVAPFDRSEGSTSNFEYCEPTFHPSQSEIDHYQSIGHQWANDSSIYNSEVQPLWGGLLSLASSALVEEPSSSPPSWWKIAHFLLIIADEACADLGYQVGANNAKWANEFVSMIVEHKTVRRVIPPTSGCSLDDQLHLSRHVARDSLAFAASRDVVRVFPKGRTPEIGCSMRTLSHNLAILPPHGYPNAYWHSPVSARSIAPAADPDLNILLIPFPFVIPDGCFLGEESRADPTGRRWGRYKIQQRWLHPEEEPGDNYLLWSTESRRSSFIAFVDRLISSAESGSHKKVNALVLPEYAVDWATYDALVRHLRDNNPNIEFVISGVSVDCNQRLGNQVTASVFYTLAGEKKRRVETHSRRKHHRWLLDAAQIHQYNLSNELDPSVLWWEFLEIETRVQHVNVFRGNSTLTSVICEDLARVEPGLTLLRNLGPNLIFALLMDGPQLSGRWPGIYATGLADDPGSSVLSITSLGLIERSNAVRMKVGKAVHNRSSIALWKHRPRNTGADPKDSLVEISVNEQEQAVLLTLKCEPAHEFTIDNRSNRDATAWYYSSHSGVSIQQSEIETNGWRWVVGHHNRP